MMNDFPEQGTSSRSRQRQRQDSWGSEMSMESGLSEGPSYSEYLFNQLSPISPTEFESPPPRNRHGSMEDDIHECGEYRAYKLIVDPNLNQESGVPVYRYDGIIHYDGYEEGGDPKDIPKDPRPWNSQRQKRQRRDQQCFQLAQTIFMIDKNYVGPIPKKGVTVTNLSVNVDDATFRDRCVQYGEIESAKVFVHPDTGCHLGFGHVVFRTSIDAKKCVQYLNNTVFSEQTVQVRMDERAEFARTLFKQAMALSGIVMAPPPPPPLLPPPPPPKPPMSHYLPQHERAEPSFRRPRQQDTFPVCGTFSLETAAATVGSNKPKSNSFSTPNSHFHSGRGLPPPPSHGCHSQSQRHHSHGQFPRTDFHHQRQHQSQSYGRPHHIDQGHGHAQQGHGHSQDEGQGQLKRPGKPDLRGMDLSRKMDLSLRIKQMMSDENCILRDIVGKPMRSHGVGHIHGHGRASGDIFATRGGGDNYSNNEELIRKSLYRPPTPPRSRPPPEVVARSPARRRKIMSDEEESEFQLPVRVKRIKVEDCKSPSPETPASQPDALPWMSSAPLDVKMEVKIKVEPMEIENVQEDKNKKEMEFLQPPPPPPPQEPENLIQDHHHDDGEDNYNEMNGEILIETVFDATLNELRRILKRDVQKMLIESRMGAYGRFQSWAKMQPGGGGVD